MLNGANQYVAESLCQKIAENCPDVLLSYLGHALRSLSCEMELTTCPIGFGFNGVILKTAAEGCVESIKQCGPVWLNQYLPIALPVAAAVVATVTIASCCRR